MSLTVGHLRRAAAKHGATVDDASVRSTVLQVVAPAGKLWTEGLSALVVEWERPEDKQEALQDALERIKQGLRDMTEPERLERDE